MRLEDLLYSLFGLFLTLLFPFSLLYLFYKGSKDIPKHASISILALSCLFVISSVFNLPLSSFEGDFFAGSFFFLQSFFVSFLLISFVLRKRVQVVSFHSLFFAQSSVWSLFCLYALPIPTSRPSWMRLTSRFPSSSHKRISLSHPLKRTSKTSTTSSHQL